MMALGWCKRGRKGKEDKTSEEDKNSVQQRDSVLIVVTSE
jgi:hypothetical protein